MRFSMSPLVKGGRIYCRPAGASVAEKSGGNIGQPTPNWIRRARSTEGARGAPRGVSRPDICRLDPRRYPRAGGRAARPTFSQKPANRAAHQLLLSSAVGVEGRAGGLSGPAPRRGAGRCIHRRRAGATTQAERRPKVGDRIPRIRAMLPGERRWMCAAASRGRRFSQGRRAWAGRSCVG